jgi:hypothetical protein
VTYCRGLDGVHRYNGLELNRKAAAGSGPGYAAGAAVRPQWSVKRITGLSSAGDPEDVRSLVVGRGLEVARRATRRGRTIVYEGLLKHCADIGEFRTQQQLFRDAFGDLTLEKNLEIFGAGYPYASAEANDPNYRMVPVRVQAADIADEWQGPRYQAPFVVSFRAPTPHTYGPKVEQLSDTFGNGDLQGSVTCNNNGSAPSDFLTIQLEATGAGGAGTLTLAEFHNITTGKFVKTTQGFSTAWTPQLFDALWRTFKETTGADLGSSMKPDQMTWWAPFVPALQLGNNTIRVVVASTTGTGTFRARVIHRPAYW